METFSALLALCEGIHQSPVDSPHKGQWRWALMFSLICLNERLRKQSRRRWFGTSSPSLCRHCNEVYYKQFVCLVPRTVTSWPNPPHAREIADNRYIISMKDGWAVRATWLQRLCTLHIICWPVADVYFIFIVVCEWYMSWLMVLGDVNVYTLKPGKKSTFCRQPFRMGWMQTFDSFVVVSLHKVRHLNDHVASPK